MGERGSSHISSDAAALAAAVARWPSWLHHRHETIWFESVNSIQRRIRLDLSIPKELADISGDWIPVPLLAVSKAERATLEFIDGLDAEAIVLTSVESRKLTAELMLAQLRLDAAEEGVDAAQLYTDETWAELLAFVSGENSLQVGLLSSRWQERMQSSLGNWYAPGIRPTTLTLIHLRRFVGDELVFLGVRPGSATRRALTVGYGQSIRRLSLPGLRSEMGRRHLAQRITELLGWRDTLTSLTVPDAGCAASLDLIVEAPDGVVLQEMPVHTLGKAPLKEVASAKADDLSGRRALHVRLSGLELWQNANVLAFLRAKPTYTAAVAFASMFAAIALTIGALSLGQLTRHSDAAVTLLLLGPTLSASLIVLRGREPVVLQIARGPRWQLGIVATLTFVAAATLVAVPAGNAQTEVWTVLAAVAWLVTAVLAVGLIQRIVQIRRFKAEKRAALERERDAAP